jgi:hypothetical protein
MRALTNYKFDFTTPQAGRAAYITPFQTRASSLKPQAPSPKPQTRTLLTRTGHLPLATCYFLPSGAAHTGTFTCACTCNMHMQTLRIVERAPRWREFQMLPRHLPAVLSCLIAALLVQWAIRRWPQRSAGNPAATAALVATLDERLATQDWNGAYEAWRSVLKEARTPGVPGSIRRARIEVAHKAARARIDRMDADFRAGFPLSSSPPYSSPTHEVVVEALRGAAIFATVDEAETLLLRALKERPFAEIAESVCQVHSNSKSPCC